MAFSSLLRVGRLPPTTSGLTNSNSHNSHYFNMWTRTHSGIILLIGIAVIASACTKANAPLNENALPTATPTASLLTATNAPATMLSSAPTKPVVIATWTPVPIGVPTPVSTIQATFVQTSTWRCGDVVDISLVDEKTGWAVVNCHASWPPRSFSKGVVYRLVDGNWQRVENAPSTRGSYSCFTAVSAIGPEEVWVTGMQGGIYTCEKGTWLFHYRNGQWETVDIDKKLFTWHYSGLLDIDMVDAENGWAVGYGLIFRYKQGQWSVEVDMPCKNPEGCNGWDDILWTISMANVNEGWAGGNDGLLFHYERGKWTRWQDPMFKSAMVHDIQAIGPGEAWAVGTRVNEAQGGHCSGWDLTCPALVWHYINGHWIETALPIGDANLYAIKMNNPQEGWVIGNGPSSSMRDNSFVILHYTHGQWDLISSPKIDSYQGATSIDVPGSNHTVWLGGWGFYRYLPPDNWEHIELPPAGVWPFD